MLLKIILHAAVDILNLGIGVYIFVKRPRDIIRQAFLLFIIGVVGWSGSMLLLSGTGVFFFATTAFLGGELVVLGFFLLAEIFPDRTPLRKKFIFSLLPWLLFALFTLTGFIIRGAHYDAAGYLKPEYGPLFPVYAATMGMYIAWGVGKLFRKYRKVQGVLRVQMRYFAGGAAVFITLGFLSNVLLPLFGIFQFNLLGPLFSIIFIASTGYAIVRHQFLDIRVVLQRGFLYLVFLTIFATLFFGIDFLIDRFTPDETALAAAILGALGFLWLRDFFQKATDRIFYRKEYQYSAAIRSLGPLLTTTIDLQMLLAAIDQFLMQTVKPERVLFIGEDGQGFFRDFFHGRKEEGGPISTEAVSAVKFSLSQILFIQEWELDPKIAKLSDEQIAFVQTYKIGAIIPFMGKEGRLVTMLLGKKLSGDIFRLKDIDLILIVAQQGGMAIENAQLYEETRRHNIELEDRVQRRTAKIQSMQEAQSKFLTDVSHELQTPVAVLRGGMDILERKRPGNRKAALAVMDATLDRMGRLIENLLAIARLNFSKDKLRRTPISLATLIEESCQDCLMIAEDKDVMLFYASENATIAGDQDKLKEVILNLVSNALKHTPPGGKITVRGSRAEGCGEISVTDTGEGIPPDELPHIFERFYRIGSNHIRGTGLGLDICKKIVEAHGGVLSAESSTGRGSCFRLTVPFVEQESELTLASEKYKNIKH